mmetsp:Transcript_78184/g.181425  ORF Transcript_78184/g.181425 Transcript_78184/m.181425 type:complete len:235 (-) Transcript_78184:63-767(-)
MALALLLLGLVGAALGLEDATSLVQAGLQSRRKGGVGFNCTTFPELCQEPFNCQSFSLASAISWGFTGVGRTQVQTWCGAPHYHRYAGRCLGQDRDLVAAGKMQAEMTEAGHFGPNTMELDGSYCFVEGLCVDKEMTPDSTLADAEAACDRKYGAKRWRSYGSLGFSGKDRIDGSQTPSSGGFTHPSQTTPYLIAACAMGNYHCDIVMCKETYCKKRHYVEKYGHLLKDFGWVQ